MTQIAVAAPTVTTYSISQAVAAVRSEAIKRLDDAIYRLNNATTVTAEELWVQLRAAQSSTTIESAYICVGILNQLKARRQITDW